MPGVVNSTVSGATVLTWQQLRDALVPGTYDPGIDLMASGASTVGVSPDFDAIKRVITSVGQSVQADDGSTAAGFVVGKTYTGLQVDFTWTPPTSNGRIKFKNSMFRGPASFSGGNVGVIKLYNAGHAYVDLEDVTIRPQNPHPNQNGLHGDRFTALRVDISRVADAIATFTRTGAATGPTEAWFRQGYVHDAAWFSQSAAAALGVTISTADGLHNDIFQPAGGSGTIVEYSTLVGYTDPSYKNIHFDSSGRINAVALVKNDDAQLQGNFLRYCLVSGGRATFNFNHNDPATDQLGSDVGGFYGSRFVRDFAVAAILRPASWAGADFDGPGNNEPNRFTDNNGIVPLTNG